MVLCLNTNLKKSQLFCMVMEFMHEIKIPKERVAVLIGTKGKIKREVEEATKCRITIDSKEGDVSISGEDGLSIFCAKDIVTAIGRGFNPDIAMLLLKQDYSFELINMADYVGKSKNKMIRIRGRVIGTEGKTRKVIEQLTETYIAIYGKTIGMIGYPQNIELARKAIEKLLAGAEHSSVYRWLEKKRKDLKMGAFEQIELKESALK